MPHSIEHRFDPKVIGNLPAGARRLAESQQVLFLSASANVYAARTGGFIYAKQQHAAAVLIGKAGQCCYKAA